MTIDKRLMSQTLLFGSLGGLVGLVICATFIWSLDGLWHPEGGVGPGMIWSLKSQTILLFYFPLGLLLGFVVTIVEPLNDSSLKEAFVTQGKWLALGALFGGLGAVLGGFVGEWVFAQLDSLGGAGSRAMTVLGRLLGTLVLGLCLGIGLGLVDKLRTKSNDRFMAGLIGGGVGGVLAALVFQFVVVSPEAMPIMPMILLAMFAAGAIGSVTFMKTKAMLVGHPENQIFKYATPAWRKQLVSDAPNLIGSGLPGRRSSQANFLVANDLNVVSEHAVIQLDPDSKRWMLARWSLDAVDLYLNNRPLAGDSVYLSDGDVISLGGTRFRLVLKK